MWLYQRTCISFFLSTQMERTFPRSPTSTVTGVTPFSITSANTSISETIHSDTFSEEGLKENKRYRGATYMTSIHIRRVKRFMGEFEQTILLSSITYASPSAEANCRLMRSHHYFTFAIKCQGKTAKSAKYLSFS